MGLYGNLVSMGSANEINRGGVPQYADGFTVRSAVDRHSAFATVVTTTHLVCDLISKIFGGHPQRNH